MAIWRRRPHQTQARMAVFDFVEGFYNSRRCHSALGQLSPPPVRGATKPDTLQPSPDPPPKRSTPPPQCRTAMEAGEAPVQSLSAWKRRRTLGPDPPLGWGCALLPATCPASFDASRRSRALRLPTPNLDLASESCTSSPGSSMAVCDRVVVLVYPRIVPTSWNVISFGQLRQAPRSDR